MNMPIGSNYKYYKCRSVLACDTGGTVYENFREFDNFGFNINFTKSKDQYQSQSDENENIVYIIDREGESKKKKISLIDLTTHLDDDEFNDFEMHFNTSFEPKNQAVKSVSQKDKIEFLTLKKSECIKNNDLVYFSSKNDSREIVQNLNKNFLKNNDISIIEDLKHNQDINSLNNTIDFKDINDNIIKGNSLADGIIYDENKSNFQYFLIDSQNNSDSSNLNNFIVSETSEYEHYPPTNSGVVSNKKHIHKRKQIYNIKDDLCSELVNEDKDLLNKAVISNFKMSKKRKSRNNKENQRKKIHQQKRNPFANLKMNSILKRNKKLTIRKNKSHYDLQNKESTSSNDENFGPSNINSKDENFEPRNNNFKHFETSTVNFNHFESNNSNFNNFGSSNINSNDENFISSNSNSNDENFEPNNSNSNNENCEENYCIVNNKSFGRSNINSNGEDVSVYKTLSETLKKPYQFDYFNSFQSKNNVLQEIGAIIKLNSEFTNADYLEYVQPRERIIESDMDKLLSPTIEIEFSEIIKSCKITQVIKDKQEEEDFNGNELNFHDVQKMNKNKSELSASEIAEKELFLKSKYAKKLGYENYFNTSNESIMNEILFDPSLTYEEIKLDLNLLKHIEMYSKCKQNSLLDKSFKSVSCTLLESINEFNRFGGFVEEICEKKGHAKENLNKLINNKSTSLSKATKLQKERKNLSLVQDLMEKDTNQINANFTFNFSNKSNLLSLDFQSRYNSVESSNNTKKPSSNSLKIKIKRINDENNEYVIDGSIDHLIDINKKKKTKSIKDVYRYKCYNCSAKFKTKRILKNHVSERHSGPYNTECEICHMKFKKSSAHKKHEPWCQKNVTHKCDSCSKVYCYRASLIKHIKTHKKLIY